MKNLNKILTGLNINKSKKIINILPTGITCKFSDFGGKIKVHTDSDKNFIPYVNSFISLNNWNKIKNNS